MSQKIIKHIHFHLTLQLEESNITLNRNFTIYERYRDDGWMNIRWTYPSLSILFEVQTK